MHASKPDSQQPHQTEMKTHSDIQGHNCLLLTCKRHAASPSIAQHPLLWLGMQSLLIRRCGARKQKIGQSGITEGDTFPTMTSCSDGVEHWPAHDGAWAHPVVSNLKSRQAKSNSNAISSCYWMEHNGREVQRKVVSICSRSPCLHLLPL